MYYTFEDLLLEVVCSLTRNEPSPRFVSNGIHTKTRPENLQENGVESKLGGSQGWSQRGREIIGFDAHTSLFILVVLLKNKRKNS